MSEEPTIEELQAKLELLQKQNLEREIALAQAEAEKAEELKKKEAEEKLTKEIEERVREDLIKEMGEESKVEEKEVKDDGPITLTANESNRIRDTYSKTPLQDVPGTPGVRAVFNEDMAFFRKQVKDTIERKRLLPYKDRSIKGRTYEDIILGLSKVLPPKEDD
jgi:hypothetical protein